MFRSAFLLATAALAAFTSAAPTVSDGSAIDQTSGKVVRAMAGDVHLFHRSDVKQALDSVDVVPRGGECQVCNECKACGSVPEVFAFIDVKVTALLDTCKKTVAAGPITVDVALKLIAEVKALVLDLTVLVKAVIALNLDVNAILKLNGAILGVTACVNLIVKVVVNILLCLDVVVKACIAIKLDLTVILNVVAEVVALVAALVKIILNIQVVVNISALLCAALKVALSVIACIDIKVLVNVIAAIRV